MRRPVPIILTAVLLGFLAGGELLLAVSMVFAGVVFLTKSLPTPPPTPFPPSFLPIMMFLFSLLFAAFAGWSIVTLVGLVRLRSWARYSVLVIAGLLAVFGGISAVTSFVMPFLMPVPPAVQNQPAADPAMMRVIFFVIGAVYAFFAAIGIALLVYYNLARMRALFLQNAPVALGAPNTVTGRPRPTAIAVISWIYLVSAPFFLIYTVLPFPAFFLGFIFYGAAAHCLYLFFAVLAFAIGYGLYRLREPARLAVFALFVLFPIQVVVLLTPWGARQFRLATDIVNAAMYRGQQAPPNVFASPGLIVFFMLVACALYVPLLWLLHRHREAFTPARPAPPMPATPAPLAG